MDNDIAMLTDIRKTARSSCRSMELLMNETLNTALRRELEGQLQEYSAIFSEADRLLRQRNAPRKGENPLAFFSKTATAFRVRASTDPSARIARHLLQSSSRSMAESIHAMRTLGTLDPKVSSLSKRLLQAEQANIQSMKPFL